MASVKVRAALYARVSSEKQAKENTIASQVASLRERIAADGLALLEEHCFVDDGHSGSTLVRPALERLRDAAYAGQLDRLYVLAPDRLARNYAYQFLLLEELQQRGVEVMFLNQSLGKTPEERMMVQMQGIVAEFERAKILERCRRGRRYAAQQGRLSALTQAPFGYRYQSKRLHGEARFEVVAEQAEVVRQLFDWVGRERLTLREVQRRLQQHGVRSPSGLARWAPSTLTCLLRNSSYRGQAIFRSGALSHDVDATPEAIALPVPALVSEALFAAVQAQLQENRRRHRQRRQAEPHLLQGLAVCQTCGRAFVFSRCRNSQFRREYQYYRCTSMLAEGRYRACTNPAIPALALEETVWQDVSAVLREPRRLAAEYQRRLTQTPPQAESLRWLEQQQTKDQRALTRLIDAYENDLLQKEEFAPRLERMRQRLQNWQTQIAQLREAQAQEQTIEQALGRLEDFAARIESGLREPTPKRREILKALVKRVEIAPDKIRVIYKIHPLPSQAAKMDSLQDCSTRNATPHCTETRLA